MGSVVNQKGYEMKKVISIIVLCAASVLAHAKTPTTQQKDAASAVQAAPQLTNTQRIALQKIIADFRSVQDAQKQVQQAQREAAGELQAFEADFAKDHPGWHFNAATGQAEKDAPAKPPIAKKR